MKNFNKKIIAVLVMATALTGCGNSKKIPTEIPVSSSEAETPATQESTTEADTIELIKNP